METRYPGPSSNNYGNTPVPLPNATPVLILGIASIPTCCCGGIVGLVCAIIALTISKKDMQLYQLSPGIYTEASFNNLKAGRVCAIIGLVLFVLYAVATIGLIARFGIEALSNPEIIRQMSQQ
jgi:hypothetical protein